MAMVLANVCGVKKGRGMVEVMDKLIPKEEMFCTLVAIEGMSLRQAYKKAYDTTSSDALVSYASRLSKNTKVTGA